MSGGRRPGGRNTGVSVSQLKAAEEGEAATKEATEANRRRIDALERILAVRAEQIQRSRLEREDARRRIIELDEMHEEEEKVAAATWGEMQRQYTAMKGELMHRITSLESDISRLQQELEESRQRLERMKETKDALIAEKNRHISEQKQRMEDMAIEFGEMLKNTLDSMGRRIDTGGDGGGSSPQ